MNNPFAAQPAQLSNPFAAAAAPAPAAPPPPAPTQGVAAIQAAFAAAPAPAANPFAPTAAPVAQASPAVQYAPLNPHGEAGLGGVTVPATTTPVVEAIVEPDPPAAPKRRGRKPRTQNEQTALDQHALSTGGPAPAYEVNGYESADAAQGVAVHEYAERGLDAFTTDQLVDALISAGYTVTITKSKD